MNRRGQEFSFPTRQARGSVLIIVLWISLGLVALTLYFANSMSTELRAADNRGSEAAARQALEGGIRYANYIITNYGLNGTLPDLPTLQQYKAEALPVGDASFWFIGRDNDNPQQPTLTSPYFALVDESSKLNLNTVTSTMLQSLPNMTPDIADAIVAWRSATNANTSSATTSYAQLTPPRQNKGAPFQSADELRLVYGVTLDLLLGEDFNRNGVLDANENDGDATAPHDNQDGQLQPGFLEYVTIYSQLPATSASGSQRINLTTLDTAQTRQQLLRMLQQRGITTQRVAQITNILNQRLGAPGNGQQGGRGGAGGGGQNPNAFRSVAEFMVVTAMTADEFALVHTDLTATTNAAGTQSGLVNVNTASQTVLACIPGIGTDNAPSLIAYRQQHPDQLTNFWWLTQVLSNAQIRQAGPYLTDQTYQISADIAAVANNGRGYCRERVVFDTTTGTARIVYRQDLTAYGWALGAQTRTNIQNGTLGQTTSSNL
jgi:DNA uptake protein ComE-like DNA-binding protein